MRQTRLSIIALFLVGVLAVATDVGSTSKETATTINAGVAAGFSSPAPEDTSAEEARVAEEQRVAAEQEAARVAAEQEAARVAAEQAAAAEAQKRAAAHAAWHAERDRQRAERRAARAVRSRSRPAQVVQTNGDVYDALAMCESGMNQMAHNGKYHSYFQWLIRTWNNVSGLPGDPHDYDYATQKAAAQKIPLSSWNTQFPGCRRKLKAQGWAIP